MEDPKPLTTVGIVLPQSFPSSQYEKTYARVLKAHAFSPAFGHFGGAFSAMAYRFRAVHDGALAFQQKFKIEGSSPPPEARYGQERLLFDFYSNCFSVLEAYFFALFAVAHMLKPKEFALATSEDEQKVSPVRTLTLLRKHYADDPIVAAITTLTHDDDYKMLRGIRNVLTHRTAPGRSMYVSIGDDDAPPTEWKLDGQPLTDDLLLIRDEGLARLFKGAMDGLDSFTQVHIR